jgi:hypothetical protein
MKALMPDGDGSDDAGYTSVAIAKRGMSGHETRKLLSPSRCCVTAGVTLRSSS